MVVDFPAPFGPKNPRIFPGSALNDTLSTAFCEPYIFVMFSTITDTSIVLIEFIQ
jgi:hypothetical protein